VAVVAAVLVLVATVAVGRTLRTRNAEVGS
jgi:hypothetical protein